MLLDDFRMSDEALIEALSNDYRLSMHRIAENILHDYYEADDAVQIAMIRIADNIYKIEDIHSNKCKNFVFVITKNVALNLLRKKKQTSVSVPRDPCEFVDLVDQEALAQPMDSYFSETMDVFLSKLKEKDRDIISLRYGDGYETHEIADILDMSPDAVRKRLFRARKHLAELIEGKELDK